MKSVGIFFSCLLILDFQGLNAQCKADSVFSYRMVGGKTEIASIEYFTFDANDSVVKKSFVEITEGKAQPVSELGIRYFKEGSNSCVEYETRTWVAERGIYRPDSRHTEIRNKKGLLMAEKYDKVGATVVAERESNYAYNKAGHLTSTEFKSWNEATKSWEMITRVNYFYEGDQQTHSITYAWDTVQNKWKEDWKIIFTYDSMNVLTETINYQVTNGAWVPRNRTVYGKEVDQPIYWNVVQEWNGAKENWSNQHYYLFQENEKGFTKQEVHLDWGETEWKINTSFQYVYNDSGMLIQILNENGQVMVDRFCKN